MNNSVLFIIPYFGKFPLTYELWKESIRFNEHFKWLLITDQLVNDAPDNLYVVHFATFEKFINYVDDKLGYKTKICKPQKLPDLKPAYMFLFENLINEYFGSYKIFDFWGYTDMDMIYGNLQKYINDDVLSECDVFQIWGHLTLIRNTECLKTLFSQKYKNYSFKNSIRCRNISIIDEGPFLLQLQKEGYRIKADIDIIADIRREAFEFSIHKSNYPSQRFYYNNGRVIRKYMDNDEEHEDEFMYIHFLHRTLYPYSLNKKDYLLSEYGFFSDGEKIANNLAYNDWNKMYERDFVNLPQKNIKHYLSKIQHPIETIYLRSIREVSSEADVYFHGYYKDKSLTE